MIEGIRLNANITIVSPQKKETIAELGYPPEDYPNWFREALGVAPDTIHPIHAITEELPSVENVTAAVIGGSGFSVYEGNTWQKKLEEWIKQLAENNIPIFAVCYGHQALMKGLGATVAKDPQGREFGVTKLRLTESGLVHPVFQGIDPEFMMYTSHGDLVLNLPEGVTPLAYNPEHPVQAVAVGKNIVGTQGHPEFQAHHMKTIAKTRGEAFITEGFVNDEKGLQQVIYSIEAAQESIHESGKTMMRNWVKSSVLNYIKETK